MRYEASVASATRGGESCARRQVTTTKTVGRVPGKNRGETKPTLSDSGTLNRPSKTGVSG